MTVTVETIKDLGVAKGQNRTVFRNPRGTKRYYSFYIQEGLLLSPQAQIRAEYSVDGVDWSNSANTVMFWSGIYDVSVGEAHAFDVKIYDTGSRLEIFVAGIGNNSLSGDHQVKYCRGVLADSASVIVWDTAQTITNITSELSDPHCVALARTDNGRIVVAFTEDFTNKGKDYRLTKLIGSDDDSAAPSWSGVTTWDDPSNRNNNNGKGEVWFGLESFGSSYPNRCFLFSRIPHGTLSTTWYKITTAVPDWNGTVFSNDTQETWDTGGDYNGWVIAGVIDDVNRPHIVYEVDDTSNYLYYRRAGAGNDAFGIAATVATVGGAVNFDVLTISIDTEDPADRLYVFYRDDTDSVDFFYKTVVLGSSTFSSEKIISYHENLTALSSCSKDVEGSLHIGGLYGTTVVYNEHPVYKALSTTLADLEFPDQNYYLGPHST